MEEQDNLKIRIAEQVGEERTKWLNDILRHGIVSPPAELALTARQARDKIAAAMCAERPPPRAVSTGAVLDGWAQHKDFHTMAESKTLVAVDGRGSALFLDWNALYNEWEAVTARKEKDPDKSTGEELAWLLDNEAICSTCQMIPVSVDQEIEKFVAGLKEDKNGRLYFIEGDPSSGRGDLLHVKVWAATIPFVNGRAGALEECVQAAAELVGRAAPGEKPDWLEAIKRTGSWTDLASGLSSHAKAKGPVGLRVGEIAQDVNLLKWMLDIHRNIARFLWVHPKHLDDEGRMVAADGNRLETDTEERILVADVDGGVLMLGDRDASVEENDENILGTVTLTHIDQVQRLFPAVAAREPAEEEEDSALDDGPGGSGGGG